MTEERLVLADLLEKAGDGDFLRAVAEAVLQLLMESDVEGMIGAGRYERNGERTTWRNGYRDRTLDTRLGALQLRIPKLRQGSDFPPFLEARKSSEKALIAVIQEAWIGGVSTRRVTIWCRRWGCRGSASRRFPSSCKEIDERVHAFLDRPLAGEWPYLWLDATYLKQREGGAHRLGCGNNRRRGQHRRPTRDRRAAYRSLGSRDFLVGLFEEPEHGGARVASNWSFPTPMRGSKRRSAGCLAPPGSAAACIGCATLWLMWPKPSRAWWRRRCARPFCSPIGPRPAPCCATSPTNCGRNGRSSPPSSTTARPMCCPTWISPNNTAANYTAPTR